MKIKMKKTFYVFKKNEEYGIIDEDDLSYMILTRFNNVIKLEKSEVGRYYKLIK